jgi:hypothetical protein
MVDMLTAFGLLELTWILLDGPPQMVMLVLPFPDNAFAAVGCVTMMGVGETTSTIAAVAVALMEVVAAAPKKRMKLLCTWRLMTILIWFGLSLESVPEYPDAVVGKLTVMVSSALVPKPWYDAYLQGIFALFTPQVNVADGSK